MTEAVDKIGVARDHRWKRAPEQIKVLEQRCRKVVSLGGGDAVHISREDLERLVRPGTVLEFVHAFLLADPRRKKLKGGLREDFRAALARLEKRGAVVVDVDAGICSQKHKRALLALADSDISRSNQGAKSATNGARSKGRPEAAFTPQQLKDAKAIWRNVKDYPYWKDTKAPLSEIVDENGIKFTPERAYDLWKGRN
jgi:hypothetical protein